MNVLSATLPEFLGSLGATLIVALAGWMKRRWRRQARTPDTTLSPATGETGRTGAMDHNDAQMGNENALVRVAGTGLSALAYTLLEVAAAIRENTTARR
ncbi:hypothetical protein [Streptomyces sp. LaBMicrA B280]|uniref:hypothetical protein n=1 Tax=Streptomyces sp. LaBMicrA B280 TaxID=3391001 RepID=UPI003BA53DE3